MSNLQSLLSIKNVIAISHISRGSFFSDTCMDDAFVKIYRLQSFQEKKITFKRRKYISGGKTVQ